MHRLILTAAAILMVTGASAAAADIIPAPGTPPAQETPPSSDVPLPEAAPSPRDPGMVKEPETMPHPDSVVVPPMVDPQMAINPDEPTGEPQKQETVPREGVPGPPPQAR